MKLKNIIVNLNSDASDNTSQGEVNRHEYHSSYCNLARNLVHLHNRAFELLYSHCNLACEFNCSCSWLHVLWKEQQGLHDVPLHYFHHLDSYLLHWKLPWPSLVHHFRLIFHHMCNLLRFDLAIQGILIPVSV